MAIAPPAANTRKAKPVISNQSWWATPEKCFRVVRAPLITAPKVRLPFICCPAMRAAIPNFRALDTFAILLDFSKV